MEARVEDDGIFAFSFLHETTPDGEDVFGQKSK
jgi:hypothetical protein